MFCVQCGTELPEQAKFCMECGAKLGEAEGKSETKMFKVTFDRHPEVTRFSIPFRLIIDRQIRKTLGNGEFLEIYLSEGEHELEIIYDRRSQYQDIIVIKKEMVILVERDKMWGKCLVNCL